MLILILYLSSIGVIPSSGQQECGGFLNEVYSVSLKKCIPDCGRDRLFDIQLDKCQTMTQQHILHDCKRGEERILQRGEVRCISADEEDDCCLRVASADDFDIRVVSGAQQGCNCTRKCEDLGQNYECVERYLCDNTGGSVDIYNAKDQCYRNVGNIDLADKTCPNHLTCCRKAKEPRTKCVDTEPSSGCGRISGVNGPGIIDSDLSGKVLEDYAAQIGEFPHMCLFYSKRGSFEEFRGGASLIGRNIVLTTATKLYYMKSDKTLDIRNEALGVRCGVLNVKNNEANLPDPQDRTVTDVVIHPEYNPTLLTHNIAILIVKDPFNYVNHISPVCLPSPSDSFTGSRECYSSGWGADKYDSPVYSDFLKKVKLPVVDSTSCSRTVNQNVQRFSNNPSKTFVVYDDWMCVGGEGIADTCRGDGGSPHVCKVNNKWVQVGAVAFGFGCGEVGIPSIYSAVAPEMCWIDWVMSSQAVMPKIGELEIASIDGFDVRQASNCRSDVVVQSVNSLSSRDCGEWLRARPKLYCQCEVNYN